MNLQGFIKEIGSPRTWKNRNGEERQTYPVVIRIPYVNAKGDEYFDEIVADHTAANPEYIEKLKQSVLEGKKMNFRVGFSVRVYEGRKYQSTNLYDITILL